MWVTLAIGVFLLLPIAAGQEQGGSQGESLQPEREWKSMGRSLWFDGKTKRVVLRARVVLREGVLEHLMCSKGTKEHEAILATDAAPQKIHAVLLLTGATVGNPVQFAPKSRPPSGSPIEIQRKWRRDGKLQASDAREWVWDEK